MSWLRRWIRILLGAAAIGLAAVFAARATRERRTAEEQGSEAELREQAVSGTGEARKQALVALDHLKRAEHLEREAKRRLDQGAKDADAEDILSAWRKRAGRL